MLQTVFATKSGGSQWIPVRNPAACRLECPNGADARGELIEAAGLRLPDAGNDYRAKGLAFRS